MMMVLADTGLCNLLIVSRVSRSLDQPDPLRIHLKKQLIQRKIWVSIPKVLKQVVNWT